MLRRLALLRLLGQHGVDEVGVVHLGEVGDVHLDDVRDIRSRALDEVELDRGGCGHRCLMVQHRLTIQPLGDAEVDLLFSKSVEVQLPVVARRRTLRRRMLQPKEVRGRTFRRPVLGVRGSRQPGGTDDLDGRLDDRLLELDVRLDEVDPGVMRSLRGCTSGFRTSLQLLKLLLELRDLEVARVRVQGGRSVGGVGLRDVEVGPWTIRSRGRATDAGPELTELVHLRRAFNGGQDHLALLDDDVTGSGDLLGRDGVADVEVLRLRRRDGRGPRMEAGRGA